MHEPFETYTANAFEAFKLAQESFIHSHQIEAYTSWHYNQASGIFTFLNDKEERRYSFQCIGSFAPQVGTWLWSWANKNTHPRVKTLSSRIREFGREKKYAKLVRESWEAEEANAWEMLAVAHQILSPLGAYRIPTENLHIFIVFIEELTKKQVAGKELDKGKTVECGIHGFRRPAFVCQHLSRDYPTGFHEPFESFPDMQLGPDEEFQAWCDACEKVRAHEGEWNDVSEGFANIRLVCEGCFFEMKLLNDVD